MATSYVIETKWKTGNCINCWKDLGGNRKICCACLEKEEQWITGNCINCKKNLGGNRKMCCACLENIIPGIALVMPTKNVKYHS